MDILIKNMEMPKDDILRIEICPDGQVNRIIGWALSEPKKAKAIELPPHGRLIDADELEGILDEVNGYGGASEITYKKMIETLHDETLSPTIVEASE